jgi:hypothetical protein
MLLPPRHLLKAMAISSQRCGQPRRAMDHIQEATGINLHHQSKHFRILKIVPAKSCRIPRRDWRDWFIMATVVGGVSYGLFTVAKVGVPFQMIGRD